MEFISAIIHTISIMPMTLAVVLIPCALIAWLAYIAKDRLKELTELRKASAETKVPAVSDTNVVFAKPIDLLTSGDTKCILCKFQVAEIVRQATNCVRDLQLELLDRQMKSIENMVVRVSRIFETEYLAFLKKTNPDIEYSIRGWEMRLVSEKIKRAFYQQIIPGLRQMLKENHLAARGDMEFELYKNMSIETIRAGSMAFVDAEYIDEYTVSREVKTAFFASGYDTVLAPAIRAELDSARKLAKIYDVDMKLIMDKVHSAMELPQN